MKNLDIKIITDRLILIPITLDNANDVFAHFTTDITKYMGPKPSDSIEQVKTWINSAINKNIKLKDLQLVIFKKCNNEFIGCAGLHDIDIETPELGIWTKKESHGNGYGREAICELFNWACNNIEFEYIRYPVDKRNIASRKIPESLNGIISREFKAINQSGFELDEIEYNIYPNKNS